MTQSESQTSHSSFAGLAECTAPRYAPGRAFGTADDYFTFLRDAFDILYEEGGKMMSIGLHLRLIGHPARMKGLRKFMDYLESFPNGSIWICKRYVVDMHELDDSRECLTVSRVLAGVT